MAGPAGPAATPLWYKLWNVGIRGKMWQVIKEMYAESKGVVFLGGEKSEGFSVEQGVAEGCSLSRIHSFVFINNFLKEIDQAEPDLQLDSGKRIIINGTVVFRY